MPLTYARLRNALARIMVQLPHLPRVVALVWKAAGRWTALWFALLIVQGLLPIATVYLTRSIVNALVGAAAHPRSWPDLRGLVILLAAMAVILLLGEMLRVAAGWARTVQSALVQDHISALIHEKSTSVDLGFYETPEFYDHLHRARADAGYPPLVMIESLGSVAQDAITLIAMAAVLIPFGAWLPAVLLLSTLPALHVVMRYSWRQHEWRHATTADERRTWYYDWLLTNRGPAAELRLFGSSAYFRSAFQSLRSRLRHDRCQLAAEQSRAELMASAVALVVTGAVMVWMLRRALTGGGATLGDLALFYQAFYQGQRLMRSLLHNIGQLYGSSLFIGNLFEYLALAPKIVDPTHPSPAPVGVKLSIQFSDVTFRYPGSERLALRDFSLSIPAGTVAAIVGPNGAGKSTVIKLLCRLYDPDSGSIEIDGVNVAALRINELRRLVSVLLQDPVHYNATAGESIALGDIAAAPSRLELVAAARAAGAEEIIDRLPHGFETLLGRSLAGGTELSVGEWQRIALARAFLRRSPIILLDEPTSAMDSWAEADWMERLRRLAAGRTAIIITHRFTTAMRADVIHVMADGRIAESGCHDDLVARGGMYAKSWWLQTASHADENVEGRHASRA